MTALRIALYSHDTMGLGHMRRNLLLAEAMAKTPQGASVLLISGSRDINKFGLPKGVDVVSLPALQKDAAATYSARHWDLSLDEIISIRATTIAGALDSYSPDVFIVDNVPQGAVGELRTALEHRRRSHTRCVLGLRDVLDDPEAVRVEWGRRGDVAAVMRDYHRVWVYGDRQVLDVAREYGFPKELEGRIRYAGYLDQTQRFGAAEDQPDYITEIGLDQRPLVLCMVGGGQDGDLVARAFLSASLPNDHQGLLITGPMMDDTTRAELEAIAWSQGNKKVIAFVPETASLVRRAVSVIAMGGYNTVCDLLSYRKRALIIPRVVPRTEQMIRAQVLKKRGLVDVLHPDQTTADTLARWIASPMPTHRLRMPVRMHTTAHLHTLLAEALLPPTSSTRTLTPTSEILAHVG